MRAVEDSGVATAVASGRTGDDGSRVGPLANPPTGRWPRLMSFAHRRRAWIASLLILVLLGQMLVAMVTAAREQGPTVDEPVYIAAATVYLRKRSLHVNPEHPPLHKLAIAASMKALGVVRPNPGKGGQWQLGERVIYGKGSDAGKILFVSRLPMIILTLLFGLVVFAFGRDLFGIRGGLVALALYAFSPDVIAHGSLATNDVMMAGFLLTTVWLLWRVRTRSHPWRYLTLAGLAYGCALATKMTALPVLPVILLLAMLAIWTATGTAVAGTAVADAETAADADAPVTSGNPRRRALTSLAAAGALGLIALAVVWASYLVIDPSLTFTRTPDMAVATGLSSKLAELLPMPDAYRGGLLVQLGFEQREFGAYLFGERYPHGVWYYLPAAMLVKTPLGMLALWVAALGTMLAVRRLRPAAVYLLLPLALLLPIAMGGSRSLGVRYVIWLPVFLAVASAALLTVRRRWVPPVVLALVAFVAVSSLRTFPYYLPYSNEAFGGPSQTYRHLNDSNVDWGQDLRRLGEYVTANHPGEPVWLIYKGRGNPTYYGLKVADPLKMKPEEVHGLLAVSAMKLSGSRDGYAPLIGGRTPIAVIGHTIFVYELP